MEDVDDVAPPLLPLAPPPETALVDDLVGLMCFFTVGLAEENLMLLLPIVELLTTGDIFDDDAPPPDDA